jgi:hypothetical protein
MRLLSDSYSCINDRVFLFYERKNIITSIATANIAIYILYMWLKNIFYWIISCVNNDLKYIYIYIYGGFSFIIYSGFNF